MRKGDNLNHFLKLAAEATGRIPWRHNFRKAWRKDEDRFLINESVLLVCEHLAWNQGISWILEQHSDTKVRVSS